MIYPLDLFCEFFVKVFRLLANCKHPILCKAGFKIEMQTVIFFYRFILVYNSVENGSVLAARLKLSFRLI